jgi:hypothetical protein
MRAGRAAATAACALAAAVVSKGATPTWKPSARKCTAASARPSGESAGMNSPVGVSLSRAGRGGSRSTSRARAAYSCIAPVSSEEKNSVLPSGDQLGLASTARARATRRRTAPSVSRMTISLIPPRSQRDAAIRVPSGDQRGSVHCSSDEPPVSGMVRDPSACTKTRRVLAGSPSTATIRPSRRASGCARRAPRVSRRWRPPFSTQRSERISKGDVYSSWEKTSEPSARGSLGSRSFRRPRRRARPAMSRR